MTRSKNSSSHAHTSSAGAPRQSAEIVRVPFQGDTLEALQDEGGVWVAVRRVADVLGLDADTQAKKLRGKAWATTALKTVVAEDGKIRQAFCIHLDSVAMWLATIETSRVAESLRPKLERYQIECARVLRDHFLGRRGVANDEATYADRPPPLPPPAEGGNGVIGKRRAGAFILGPLREIARLAVQDEGVETDPKLARKQMARCLREAHDELRVRISYHMGSAQRWELVTEGTLGEATRHLWNMHARTIAKLRRRGERTERGAQGSLFGEGLMTAQKNALKRPN